MAPKHNQWGFRGTSRAWQSPEFVLSTGFPTALHCCRLATFNPHDHSSVQSIGLRLARNNRIPRTRRNTGHCCSTLHIKTQLSILSTRTHITSAFRHRYLSHQSITMSVPLAAVVPQEQVHALKQTSSKQSIQANEYMTDGLETTSIFSELNRKQTARKYWKVRRSCLYVLG